MDRVRYKYKGTREWVHAAELYGDKRSDNGPWETFSCTGAIFNRSRTSEMELIGRYQYLSVFTMDHLEVTCDEKHVYAWIHPVCTYGASTLHITSCTIVERRCSIDNLDRVIKTEFPLLPLNLNSTWERIYSPRTQGIWLLCDVVPIYYPSYYMPFEQMI